MHNIYYQGLSGERSLPFGLLVSKMFYQIKMQAATNWSSHLKKNQTFEFFQTTDFYAIFKNRIFRDF